VGRLGEGDRRARRRLHAFHSDDHGAWEVGYGLRRDRWGRGYATEAVLACLRRGFELLEQGHAPDATTTSLSPALALACSMADASPSTGGPEDH
jgi:Acetyltransferase (GNAT) domain